ncbi:MAG: PDZ domain-containing protein [Bryobacterales bacterium]
MRNPRTSLVRLALGLLLFAGIAAAEGAIGVLFMDDPSPGVLAHFGGVEAGVVVMEAAPGGPAEKAGLKLGDVIIAIDGKPVKAFEDVSKALAALEPGQTTQVTFRRHKEQADGHDEKTVSVSIVDRATFWKAELEKQQQP